MAFLRNDGDIVLDAVICDAGRQRLARGDGSFKIVKFALSDEEISYADYNPNHTSGSAYYDLDILSTPILEAFTNNQSSMKTKLISIPRTNLLYLPVIKLNTVSNPLHSTLNSYVITVNKTTENDLIGNNKSIVGLMQGSNLNVAAAKLIRVDQGLDTTEISPSFTLDPDLVETQYIVQIDNRFGRIVSKDANLAAVSYIDDDNIANYFFTLNTDRSYVRDNSNTATDSAEAIAGPRGTILEFAILASLDLNTTTYLFTTLGGTDSTTISGVTAYSIDTTVRIQGATTGYQVDIPIRFLRKQ